MEWKEKYDVIIFGLGNTAQAAIEYIKMRFNVIGCSDNDLSKHIIADELGFKFINPSKLSSMKYDYILIVSVYDEEIWKQLIDNDVEQEKILKRKQWDRLLFCCSFGEKNPDKTFYLLSRPIHIRDGLFSYLFAFLEQMDFVEKNNYIPVVDMQNYKNQYLADDKIGVENAWEYYFQPLSEYTLSDVYASKNVILGYDDPCYKGRYNEQYNIRRMSDLYQKYVRYNNEIYSAIQEERKKYIDSSCKTLGVLYRGSDMNALKLKNHSIQPSIDEMIALAHKYMDDWGCKRIFLSTEDAEAADKFKTEFGALLSCTEQKRFCNTGIAWIADINFERQNDRYLRGLEYLITIELLAECDSLLAGICAGSVCAQIINNGKYEHIKMVDKGEYI